MAFSSTQEEKGSRFVKSALFAFSRPMDHDAREELLVRALYRQMQDDYFDTALRIVEHRAAQGGGPKQ